MFHRVYDYLQAIKPDKATGAKMVVQEHHLHQQGQYKQKSNAYIEKKIQNVFEKISCLNKKNIMAYETPSIVL